MSVLGQKRTCALQTVMSALGQKQTLLALVTLRFLLHPAGTYPSLAGPEADDWFVLDIANTGNMPCMNVLVTDDRAAKGVPIRICAVVGARQHHRLALSLLRHPRPSSGGFFFFFTHSFLDRDLARMMQSGSGGKSGARATYLFYCVIAVLLNAVLALA
jgi:hypothetical protein